MFDRNGDGGKGFADTLPTDLDERKGSDIYQRFEVHPLAPFPKKWSMKVTMESAQRDGLDLSKNPYNEKKGLDGTISSSDLIGFDLSKDGGHRGLEKSEYVPSKDLTGLDLSPIHHNPLDLNNFRIRPNRRRRPLNTSARSRTRYGSEERKFSPDRKYLPFIFLLIAISAYVYIIFRVQLGIDLPEFLPMNVSNVNLFLALCMILLLTILSNQIWRIYLVRTYYKKVRNGGEER